MDRKFLSAGEARGAEGSRCRLEAREVQAGVIPKGERLCHPGEFQAVFQGGRRTERPSVLIFWQQVEGTKKVGFAVSRQIRGAVPRNRARRRVREAYRADRRLLPPRVRVVFMARRRALSEPFDALRRDVRAGLEAIANGCGTGKRD